MAALGLNEIMQESLLSQIRVLKLFANNKYREKRSGRYTCMWNTMIGLYET